jgi:hypothetical protein
VIPSTQDRFEAVLSAIEPVEERLNAAKVIPARIRGELQQTNALRTVAPHTLLVGSYRRHTAISQLKDVDIAVLVAKEYATQPPAVVLGALADAVDRVRRTGRLRNIERHEQRRSLRCELPDRDFRIDLVPVVALTGDPYGELRIPDRVWKTWEPTRSIGYVLDFSALNAASGNKLVPLVKLMKHWRAAQQMDRTEAKSFWIEALIVSLVRERRIDLKGSWDRVIESALSAMYQRCLPVYNMGNRIPFIQDPMLPSRNVAHNWTLSGFHRFFGKLDASQRHAAAAVAGDDATAAGEWRRVFGESFAPSPWDEVPLAMGATALGIVLGGILAVLTGRRGPA